MLRMIFFFVSFIWLISCGRIEKQTSSGEVEVTFDSLNKELAVYSFNTSYKRNGSKFGLVSMTESYVMDSNSLAIPNEYLNYNKAEQANIIKLTYSYRKRFLEGTHISETDKVFIYHYASNTLITLNVRDLDVVAQLNGYLGPSYPISEDDFYYGFEINLKNLSGFTTDAFNTFICVGKENPFIIGQIEPIKWEKADSTAFPKSSLQGLHDTTQYSRKDTYKYQRDNFVYFIQDASAEPEIYTRHLVIKELSKDVIIKDAVYSMNEETSLTPLNGTESASIYNYQFTGKLFVNRPPVFFGFHEVSFGCDPIGFLKQDEADITIRCDNRH